MVRKLIFISLIAGFNYPVYSQLNKIGYWAWDEKQLPVFSYTGKIPYNYVASDGQKINLPADPWFLLGNYKLTSFIYTTGIYDLYCYERAWGKLNDAKKTKTFIIVDKKKYDITGIDSKYACNAKKEFGTGFAKFVYNLPEDIEITRIISVAPSEKVNTGIGALFFNVYIKNKGSKNVEIEYAEQVNARYSQISQRSWISYPAKCFIPQKGLSKISFSAKSTYGVLPAIDEPSLIDVYPPVLFQYSDQLCEIVQNIVDSMEISSSIIFKRTLKANEKTNIRLVTGWDEETNLQNDLPNIKTFLKNSADDPGFRGKWVKVLPVFKREKDTVFRREMTWNAYNLEAMAKYNSYFEETFIPQGMAYDFQWGLTGATRDLLFFSLPVSYYNPPLAKSIIKLVSKTMLPSGELPYGLRGFALNTNEGFSSSDFQLDFFWAVANYLQVTSDYNILNETSSYYPKGCCETDLISKLEKAFVYLRDQINVGSHGIIRLLNSDWNDQIWSNYSLSIYYWVAESDYNSALALYSLDELSKAFSLLPQNFNSAKKARIEKLASDMQLFRTQQLKAFTDDMGDRVFPRRGYINNDIVLGNEFMYSESVGMSLLIPEISKEKKAKLIDEAEKRLLNGELSGPRLSDKPIEKDKNFLQGTRENAGVWYFTGAIMTLGFAEVDKSKALNMLKMKTFNNAAVNYPDFWSGQWTNLDCTNSSLAKYPGLPDDNQFSPCITFPAYCSHAHSWPLYVYYKLKYK